MSGVDDYVSKVDPPLRGQFEKLRSLIKRAFPGVSESIKWNVPYYTFNRVGVASIADYRDHVNLYLMQGALLSSTLLEGTGRGMRHVTVRADSKVDEAEILRLLRKTGELTTVARAKEDRQGMR